MSTVQKISIDLSPRLNSVIQEAVASGKYASVSDVVEEALFAWEEHKNLPQFSIEELRQFWNEGIASGSPKALSIEDIISKARNRFEESRVKSA